MKTSHADALLKKSTPYSPCHLCPLADHPLETHSIKGFTYGDGSYQCSNCSLNTESRNEISTHMKTNYTCFRFKCPNCKFRGYNMCRLKDHKCKTHEPNQKKLLVCQECDFNTQNRVHFTEHVEAAHEGIVHMCKLCNFNTSFKTEMKEHERAKHPTTKQYNCKSCSFMTEDMLQLGRHNNSEHKFYKSNSDGSISCLFCNFTPRSVLRHAKITIRHHIKSIHNKEKDLQCNVCMVYFAKECTLKIHKARKHGELNGTLKQLACTYSECKYKTNLGWLLSRHVDKIHIGKRFPCKLCDYSGYDKRAILTHIQNKHIPSLEPNNSGDWQNQ